MSIALDEIPAATRKKLGLQKPRTQQFSKEEVRTNAFRVLAAIADLKPDQRRRVLEHALKLNRL